jgi:hypothetical protein
MKKKISERHGKKYVLDKVSANRHRKSGKITMICPEHGEYEVVYHNIVQFGTDCAQCMKGYNISKKETEWLDSFNNKNILRQKVLKLPNGKTIKPDGYDPISNTIYEFWGDIWHGNLTVLKETDRNPVNKQTYKDLNDQTNRKIQLITNQGYKLIQIWESEYDRK